MIFIFKTMAFCRLGFLNSDLFLAYRVQKANEHQHSKFHRNQSNGFWNIAVFTIFKMAAVCNLGFLKYQNFIGGSVRQMTSFHAMMCLLGVLLSDIPPHLCWIRLARRRVKSPRVNSNTKWHLRSSTARQKWWSWQQCTTSPKYGE